MRIPKASEFFISGINGTELTLEEQTFLKKHPVQGIILFKSNIESLPQLIALNKSIIEINSSPPLISVDQEGGRVARLRGLGTDLLPMARYEAKFREKPELAYRIGAMQGRELVALGFNMNFAPVCDVLNHNDNEVIGDRAFSSCPKTVALLASNYIRGLQGSGIAASAKHFPGHGATSIDSHLALPRIDTSVATLHNRELLPFREAINADVATIMTAHIVVSSLENKPATISNRALTGLLREELNFSNVIISDDLDMKAVADHYSLTEIIKEGILASVDLFIIGNNFAKTKEAVQILQNLIDHDESIREQAVKSMGRLEKLRRRYLGKPQAPDLSLALSIVRSKPHLELAASCG